MPTSESQRTYDFRPRSERIARVLTHLCGGALAANLLLVFAVLGLLIYEGVAAFWPRSIELFVLADGTRMLGEVHERALVGTYGSGEAPSHELKVKVGNRDLGGADFSWVKEVSIVERTAPEHAVVLERTEWGNLFGTMTQIRRGDTVLAAGPVDTWRIFGELHARKTEEQKIIEELEKDDLGEINRGIEDLRLRARKIEIESPPDRAGRLAAIERDLAAYQERHDELAGRLQALRSEHLEERLTVQVADGRVKELPIAHVVRAVRPNALDTAGALGVYASRVWEFVADDPRESNTEGGILPAIFGTVLMVFLMSVAVVPLGVLAALYLREYASQGPLVRVVRIAVNNLAGTPSIVFGVFGLGFFVYLVGGSIDALFYPERLPTPTFGTGGILWASLTLALLTVPVVIVATEEGLSAVPRVVREGSLALGATKWETLRKVVLPASTPAILTGTILAMGRAAGEVAPLMIVGMVKLAPALPIDGQAPYFHPERKFMHLGFHIFDLGFQSPNVEATKPLVFATALLLVMVITLLNLFAIRLRNHLRRKYATSGV